MIEVVLTGNTFIKQSMIHFTIGHGVWDTKSIIKVMFGHTSFTVVRSGRVRLTVIHSVVDTGEVLWFKVLTIWTGDTFIGCLRVSITGDSVSETNSILKVISAFT